MTQTERFQKRFPRIMTSPDPPNCLFCKEPHTRFTDAISVHEYFISGLCQSCQDDVFVLHYRRAWLDVTDDEEAI